MKKIDASRISIFIDRQYYELSDDGRFSQHTPNDLFDKYLDTILE